TNNASEYVVFQAVHAPNVPITEKTIPFAENFKERYGNYPSYAGYTTYDEVYIIADAIERAGTTEPDALVEALEKTDYTGTIGQIQFYGKDDRFTHGIKFGEGGVQGLLLQYQDGEQVVIWPEDLATGKLKFPDYMDISGS
ncbi:MAG TPA: ABC transporter substrate-binding protein, partial [Paracoccaceae bacterium]|nr:ABC transporter substrate-binding protein [Paracoccaceae bacterium]